MSTYNIVASTEGSTVVAEYVSAYESGYKRSDAYQSEAELECEFIRLLSEQGYEYLTIHDEKALINNLRHQLELINDYIFSDSQMRSSLCCQSLPSETGPPPLYSEKYHRSGHPTGTVVHRFRLRASYPAAPGYIFCHFQRYRIRFPPASSKQVHPV